MTTSSRSALLPAVFVMALGTWACSDASRPVTPEADGPLFSRAAGGKVATGGGRTDYPFGLGKFSNTSKKDYQTWGFNFEDRDGDGTYEKGQLMLVDHRPELRPQCGGNPCQFHSVRISTVSMLSPEECSSGRGWRADGEVEERNTMTRYPFEAEVCDNGEPGRNNPKSSSDPGTDLFEFFVAGFSDAQSDGSPEYCIKIGDSGPCGPGTDAARGALLTGGNIQAQAN